MNTQKYLLWFKDISEENKKHLGRKGVVLSTLSQAKFRVPKGFVVTPKVFSEFVEKNYLIDKIQHQIKNIDIFNPSDLDIASKRISLLIKSSEFPKKIALTLINAYHSMKSDNHVAVRGDFSINKDSIGHQEPILNVVGETNLQEAVRKVWASIFNHKLISKIHQKNINVKELKISVIVEQMIGANTSGVAYTQTPGLLTKNQLTIHSVWGIKDKYIKDYYPDQYHINRDSLEIISKQVTDQRTQLKRELSGIEEKNVNSKKQNSQKLSDENIIKLAKISKKIQAKLFFPQKIEWAEENGNFYIIDSQNINENENIVPIKPSSKPSIFSNMKTIISGEKISNGLTTGRYIKISKNEDIKKIKNGDVVGIKYSNLIYDLPKIKISGCILENASSHQKESIYIKELAIPSISVEALPKIKDGSVVTLNASSSVLYHGSTPSKTTHVKPVKISKSPQKTATKIFTSLFEDGLGNFNANNVDGVCFVRGEFVINQNKDSKSNSENITNTLVKLSNKLKNKPLFYRFSDYIFDQNTKYSSFGYRGALKHINNQEIIKLESRAVFKAINVSKNNNIRLIIPFVRTIHELIFFKKILADLEIKRSSDLQIWSMIETPSAALCTEKFIEAGIDGFVIGVNDLTMLTLGVDRNLPELDNQYNERDDSVQELIKRVIQKASKHKTKTIIAGEDLSIHPDTIESSIKYGAWGITSSPSFIDQLRHYTLEAEKKLVGIKKLV
ncbi:PEP/pyruvate-binding domain-containing protein [Patescibacteria group bacterium]